MALRWKVSNPMTVVTATEMQHIADNGVVQIDTAADLDSPSLINVNVAYVKADLTPYRRVSAGVGAAHWETLGGYNEATGGDVSEVANYKGTGQRWRVHTFTANGTFTVTKHVGAPFDVLLVGGGGGGTPGPVGGPTAPGSGGGAGGVIEVSSVLIGGAMSVTVGAGGAPEYPGGETGLFDIGIGVGGGGAGGWYARNAGVGGNGTPNGGSGGGGAGGTSAAGGVSPRPGIQTHPGAPGGNYGGGGGGGAGGGPWQATGGSGILPASHPGVSILWAKGGDGGYGQAGVAPAATAWGGGGNGGAPGAAASAGFGGIATIAYRIG